MLFRSNAATICLGDLRAGELQLADAKIDRQLQQAAVARLETLIDEFRRAG